MRTLLTKLKQNTDLYNTVVVGVGSIIASIFSYFLQLYLGRNLTVSDFGAFSALLSLYYLINVPATVFSTSLVKTVSEMDPQKDKDRITYLFSRLGQLAILVGFSIFLGVFAFRFVISDQLQISNTGAISVYGILMGLGFVGLLPHSYLQGLQKFTMFAIYLIVININRFIIPAILVALSFGLTGVFSGMSIAILLSFLIGFLFLKSNFSKVDKSISLSGEFKKLLSLSLPVLLIHFCMMAMNNVDVILIKKYFDEITAGYYAGTVTLGKIILFGAGAVTIVMYPRISALHSKGQEYRKIFRNLFTLQIIIVLSAVTVFALLPGFITNLFFGERFLDSISYLPFFSIFIGLYVFVYFLTMFSLAIDKRKVYMILIPLVLTQFLLITFFHSTIFQVIKINIFVCIIALIALLAFTLPKILVDAKEK
ncbi:oligosaccharide flippase family protein [Patescibacteria group bacterium]